MLAALETDPSSIVRETAAWSLAFAHGDDEAVRPALERAAAQDVARKSMKLVFVDHADQVIDRALIKPRRVARPPRARGAKAGISQAMSSVN